MLCGRNVSLTIRSFIYSLCGDVPFATKSFLDELKLFEFLEFAINPASVAANCSGQIRLRAVRVIDHRSQQCEVQVCLCHFALFGRRGVARPHHRHEKLAPLRVQ